MNGAILPAGCIRFKCTLFDVSVSVIHQDFCSGTKERIGGVEKEKVGLDMRYVRLILLEDT